MNFDIKTITSSFHCKILTGLPQYLSLLEISPRTSVKEFKLPHSVTFLQLFTKLVLNLLICFHYFFPPFTLVKEFQNMDTDRDAGPNIGTLYFIK